MEIKNKKIPQLLYIGGELLLSLPEGEFLYFPRNGPHMYLDADDVKHMVRMNNQNSYLIRR